MTSYSDRFKELRNLLRSYEETGYTFDDTPDHPGVALAAFLRQAARHPGRAAAAAAEIDDLLSRGLFSEEIADDVDLLPHIAPPVGSNVEACLLLVRQHLAHFLEGSEPPAPVAPQTTWEWKERFPELAHFLSAYFHQDFDVEYASHREAVDDYLDGVSEDDLRTVAAEIQQFLVLNADDVSLRESSQTLGLRIGPPKGVSLRRWLNDVREIITHRK
ncbi:contact-dependent growth inhibition system immunity protein [Streptomyces peucetius]|uniref:Contact-dependent growth inhibition system immunity protein n=1 Tax=Streptomyces peucetius TaxID=1950 RepID=A0ABY6I6Z7_STRPE|nr:contact-dependent growth inhibition system immunity protein [Streptomyces peucetius]UYQ62616.1 contact-dependent growth inhibition system immunity protein [Streptomyces peucetius]